ncbi:hypothetical protein LTR86_011346, partial [Recurvomyces mirabilis]
MSAAYFTLAMIYLPYATSFRTGSLGNAYQNVLQDSRSTPHTTTPVTSTITTTVQIDRDQSADGSRLVAEQATLHWAEHRQSIGWVG